MQTLNAASGSESNGIGLPFSTLYCRIHPRCDCADLDLDAGMLFSPSPNESLHFAESFDVIVVRSVLADFEPAVGVDQNLGQTLGSDAGRTRW